tara:strand:+ start:259 stop:591 length:333 start_codon:yes stop_codon:yes gene_type:complete
MKAICIDSANKPENISDYEWIEEGTVYTIIEVVEMGLQKGKLGIALEEIELTDASAPYKYYSLERFLLVPDDMTMTVENVMDAKIGLKEAFKKKKEIDVYAEDADLTHSI